MKNLRGKSFRYCEFRLQQDVCFNICNVAVDKNHLYPSAAPLTRYTETVISVIKKRLLECAPLDDDVICKLNELTIPKLCIRLNTLQVSVFCLSMLVKHINTMFGFPI